ncbi:hypothetical protein ACETIH_18020 [Microvirga arabica]|uniref:PepSY domain-containing protein n=1 Tax=Microvirga arabica TaxID=1128671 RepID=A0ABV6YBA3_9HYPH
MRKQLVAALATAVLIGGSTVVLAQSNSQGGQGNQDQNRTGSGMNQPGINRNWVPGPLSPAAENQPDNQTQYNRTWLAGSLSPAAGSQNNPGQLQGQSRASQRTLLRQELRQAGFQNIRILDAAFLVQASTGSGQQVMMVINPPEQDSMATSSSSASDQTFNNQGALNQRQQAGSSRNSGMSSNQNQLSAAIMTPGLVSQDQIRSHLHSRGFSNISGLAQDGTTYTGMADWYGEQVDFRIDGRNGFVIEPSHITPSQVRTMLNEQGWDMVGNLQQQGTSYRVQASRNGTSYNLWIDARTGEINQQTASTSGRSGSQGSGAQQNQQ